MACQISDPEEGRTVALSQTMGWRGPSPCSLPQALVASMKVKMTAPPPPQVVGGVE